MELWLREDEEDWLLSADSAAEASGVTNAIVVAHTAISEVERRIIRGSPWEGCERKYEKKGGGLSQTHFNVAALPLVKIGFIGTSPAARAAVLEQS